MGCAALAWALMWALALSTLAPATAYAETFTHGYLRYEVVDQSVTIIGYEGREEAVTVPAMIGGNPVNTIAAGAFADAATVSAVYLPDTVTSVEQGAFGVGQAVVFGGRADGVAVPAGDGGVSGGDESSGASGGGTSDGNGSDTEANDESGQGSHSGGPNSTGDSSIPGEGTADVSQGSPSGGSARVPAASGSELGIRMGDGSLVTVDDEGNLVLVDAEGLERVLDDSRSYERMTRPDGTVAIVNDAGDEVVVADGSKVSFSDAEGRQVVVDAARDTMTATAEGGSYGYEEVEIGDNAEESSAQDVTSDSEKKTDEKQDAESGLVLPIVAVAAMAVVIVAAVVYRKRGKR